MQFSRFVILAFSAAPLFSEDLAFADDPANKKLAALTWTDPKKAAAEDLAFTIQGEYGTDRAGQPWGVQVIALGGDEFDAYLLAGGLPGLGWTRDNERTKLSGKLADRAVQLASEDNHTTGTILAGKIQVQRDGKTIADLKRIERRSPTLGAKPPAGAIVLFDGKSADAWVNGRVEEGLLANENITTKQKFNDYHLHLEFRTPYKPYARGQARGNSGVYHQGRYETQVLDSFGLEGRQNETGGIYSIAKPRLNMCFPPLSWQTYDVDFTTAHFDSQQKLLRPARITVRLNGIVVQADQELKKTTTAARIKTVTPEPGPLFIQHHNNPVYYRNIWIIPR